MIVQSQNTEPLDIYFKELKFNNFENAKKQLNLAAKLVAYDFKHRSIIEQRIIDVEQIML